MAAPSTMAITTWILVLGAGAAHAFSPMVAHPGLAFSPAFSAAAPGVQGTLNGFVRGAPSGSSRRAALLGVHKARMMAVPATAAAPGLLKTTISAMAKTPDALFQSLFIALATAAILLKVLDRDWKSTEVKEVPPDGVRSLQARFLAVFWMMRMADWLQGPYFYDVYASEGIRMHSQPSASKCSSLPYQPKLVSIFTPCLLLSITVRIISAHHR